MHNVEYNLKKCLYIRMVHYISAEMLLKPNQSTILHIKTLELRIEQTVISLQHMLLEFILSKSTHALQFDREL